MTWSFELEDHGAKWWQQFLGLNSTEVPNKMNMYTSSKLLGFIVVFNHVCLVQRMFSHV